MASLESLPAPLPLQILMEVHDLRALDAARRSCPMFAAVFARHAVELLEHFMMTTLWLDVILQMRFYVLILHASLSQIEQHSALKELYRQASYPLSREIAPEAVFCALRTFSCLAAVCDDILHSKLQQLQALPHAHLKDKFFSYPRQRHVAPELPPQEGIAYQLPVLSPPNWVEQQRLLRALWTLQIRQDVATATAWEAQLGSTGWQRDTVNEAALCVERKAFSMDRTNQGPPSSWHSLAERPRSEAESLPVLVALEEEREIVTSKASRRPLGYGFSHGAGRWYWSPLRHADWKVLRKLGLGIWDRHRMTKELQLIQASRETPYQTGEEGYLSSDDLLFTWNSLYLAAREDDEPVTIEKVEVGKT